VTAVEICGPGARRTGGGFIGGGFDLQGAAEAMLIAAALNMLTTRTTINTVICLQTTGRSSFCAAQFSCHIDQDRRANARRLPI
jgi:hypothetical protein